MYAIPQGSPPESDFKPPPRPILAWLDGSPIGLIGAIFAGVFALVAAFSPILLR